MKSASQSGAMPESEWRKAIDPRPMLEFLCSENLISDRKQRLFDCACARRAQQYMENSAAIALFDLAERYADSHVALEELLAARAAVLTASDGMEELRPRLTQSACAVKAAVSSAWEFRSGVDPPRYAAFAVGLAGLNIANREDRRILKQRLAAERKEQALLLRDIVNPFKPRIDCDGPEPYRVAAAIYQAGDFTKLPALGEALQRSKVDDPKMLAHCWLPGPHVRGCWVVDLVLGWC